MDKKEVAAVLEEILPDVDLVLIMSVNPGFGGQQFIPAALEKIARLRALAGGRPIEIEVDGGINPETAAQVAGAGANVLVAGNAVFKAGGAEDGGAAAYRRNIEAIRNAGIEVDNRPEITPEELVRDAAQYDGMATKYRLMFGTVADMAIYDVAYWRSVPIGVWEYTIGGYQVIKKWLSYREKKLLGRGLKAEEAQYVTEMVRRLAALQSGPPGRRFLPVAAGHRRVPGQGRSGADRGPA